MALSEVEKSQIRALLNSPVWAAVQHAADDMIASIQKNSMVRDNEFETLKAVFGQEGKVEAIRDFMRELFNLASQ